MNNFHLNNKNLILIFLIILLANKSHSQVYEEWVQRYNGSGNGADEYPKTAIDNFGNVYVTGISQGSGSGEDYVTIKYNSEGIQQWVQRYNGSGNNFDRSNAITVDNAGNIYVTGTSYAGPSPGTVSDYATIKYNSSGILQWIQRYNGSGNGADEAREIAVDNSGNIYVTGWSDSAGIPTNYADYATIKYSSTGILQWVKRYNGPGNGNDQATEITIDNSGNVYVSGQSKGIGTDFDVATIKYNSSGIVQWVQRYNNTINGWDAAYGIVADNSGNVYVTGISNGITKGFDFLTLKYNSTGNLQWFKTYNGTQNQDDFCHSIQLDYSGNVIILGTIQNINSSYDFATVKYNSSGILQWIKIYAGPGLSEVNSTDLKIDNSDNIYVTGYGYGNLSGADEDIITIKYNSVGNEEWMQTYDGNVNGDDITPSIQINNLGYVYLSCTSMGNSSGRDFVTLKYSPNLSFQQPTPYSKLISGDTSIIKWTGWNRVNIIFQVNSGTASQADSIIAMDTVLNQSEYNWRIPENFLSFRSKIIIENAANPTQKIESGIFRIKPYLLTRVNPDSTYYEYRKNRDQWGFWNDSSQMFPHSWYQQFDYQGIDPFTGSQYSQWQGNHAFEKAKSKEFPDWVSWVNTFTINSCYWSTSLKWYRKSAILKWEARRDTIWNGSCFGISISNALAFRNKNEFLIKYSSFPPFAQPIIVTSTDPVKRVINELQTHWFGEPHQTHTRSVLNKTPNQTLDDIKKMLLNDKDSLRTLYIRNNGLGGGAHEIVAFKVTNVISQPNEFNIHVYDVSYPESLNTILINTADNGGKGSWIFANWNNWGGDSGIYLEDIVDSYLINPTFPTVGQRSPFILDDSLLQIYNPANTSILIKDKNENITGYNNDTIFVNIPGSSPILIPNGSVTPPCGYNLITESYSVDLSNLHDKINLYFFTGNNSFSYERFGATASQTDKLYFDGGVSVSNPDPEVKTISLLNIQDETTHEKLFAFSSLDMAQNDSLKIENIGSDNFKLISYGTTKNYNIELNYGSQTEQGRFLNVNIDLPSNSSHTFIPVWNTISTSQLVILQDIGNNGTIDDTLRINNIISNLEEVSLLLPDKYSLAQNYPNPFNPSTLIKYDIKLDGMVTLKVYNILGKEVASLVNEIKRAGSYEVEFKGLNLSSGIYYYRLEAGEFNETRKMLLLK